MLSQRDASHVKRVRDAVSGDIGLGHVTEYAEKNIYLRGRLFSTKGHAYQQAILDDPSHDIAALKSRQLGFTALIKIFALAMVATTPNITVNVLLPWVNKALAIIKSRYDPVLQGSPALKALLVAGSDSSSFKQIGSSQIVAGGTHGSEVISVPVDIRIVDEYDFCHMAHLSTSESSMDHSRFVDLRTGLRGLRRSFSTPIVSETGIHALYMQSDRKKRLVYPPCNHEPFWPEYLKHAVVDGWDQPIGELTPGDIASLDARGLLRTGRLLCPQCHRTVPQERLADPYREWVREITSEHVTRSGWWLSPYDAPYDEYNRPHHTTEFLLRARLAYGANYSLFLNHALGIPHSDASNSVLDDRVVQNTVLAPLSPEAVAYSPVYGLVSGCDTGQPSWVVIGRPTQKGLDVLWLARVELPGLDGDTLPERLHALLNPYRLRQSVIDKFPYTDAVHTLQSLLPEGALLAADYGLRDSSIQNAVVKEPTAEVSLHRTRVLSACAAAINKGLIRFPRHPLMGESVKDPGTVRAHLNSVKRVQVDPDNLQSSEWVNSGSADHFFHALSYAFVAADRVRQEIFVSGFTPLPSPRPVTPGSLLPKDDGFRNPREEIIHGVVLTPGNYWSDVP